MRSDGVGPGDLIGGRYALVEPLGHGGFGSVWVARDTRADELVALKRFHLPATLSRSTRRNRMVRMRREVRALRTLRAAPHVVDPRSYVWHDDTHWLVMRWIEGSSLHARLQSGAFDAADARTVAVVLLRALAALQAATILHRDIKPRNIVVRPDGEPVLVDFGLALPRDPSGRYRGSASGTALYMAPERLFDEDYGTPSDVYSLGATLYEVLEGEPPPHVVEATHRHVAAVTGLPRRHRGVLAEVVVTMLAIDPRARPTVPEALRALGAEPAQPGGPADLLVTGVERRPTSPAPVAVPLGVAPYVVAAQLGITQVAPAAAVLGTVLGAGYLVVTRPRTIAVSAHGLRVANRARGSTFSWADTYARVRDGALVVVDFRTGQEWRFPLARFVVDEDDLRLALASWTR